jgi:regulator of replication initiation timing
MQHKDVSSQHDWQQIFELWENFDEQVESPVRTYQIKQQAAEYLDIDPNKKLGHQELRLLLGKAEKMKTSSKKEVRARGVRLAKEIQGIFNLNK